MNKFEKCNECNECDECDKCDKFDKKVVFNNNINCGNYDPNRATGLAAFGYVFDNRPAGQIIPAGENVLFNNNGPLKNITHTIDTDSILVNQAGIYNIGVNIYTINTTPGATQNWAVAVNGVVISLFQAAGQSLSSNSSLYLNANDIITIKNAGVSTTPSVLRNGTTGASVLIIKVD